MKFLRHLLSHIMFFILIAGIVAIYYFRNQVVPAEYVDNINHYAEIIHPSLRTFKHTEKELLVVHVKESPLPDVAVNEQAEIEAEVVKEITEKVEEQVERKPEEANYVNPEPDMVVEKEEASELKTEVVVKEENTAPLIVVPLKESRDKNLAQKSLIDVPFADKEVEDVEKPVAVEPVPKIKEKVNVVVAAVPVKEIEKVETVNDAVVQSSDEAAADYKMMLQSARSLFQNKKFKESIDQYKELIELENHEADYYGELGNVYYAMGSWNMAGEAYFEAAQRLIETGDLSQVYYLQRVLQGLDKNRAEKLKTHLSGLAR